jgi:hypothetical protein
MALPAVSESVIEVAQDKDHKHFPKMAQLVLAQAGITTVTRSEVTHRVEATGLEEIRELCLRGGYDYEVFIRERRLVPMKEVKAISG